MRRPTKLWTGLYGLVFHAMVVVVLVVMGIRSGASIPAGFWWRTAPPFLLSAFAVYAVVVAPYVLRRSTARGAVFFDSAVGMFAECAVVVVTAIVYAFIAAARGDGSVGYLEDVSSTALFAFLWSFGSFFIQILVVGNAAGLVGWYLLKKLSARAPPGAHAPHA